MAVIKPSDQDLQSLIRLLESEGELLRISEEVDPFLEITEIYLREAHSPDGGKALLFEKVKGSELPLVINIFGSFRRLFLCFGRNRFEDYAREMRDYFHPEPVQKWLDNLRMGWKYKKVLDWFPRSYKGSNPPCQELVFTGDEVDLHKLPVQTCWPLDAGPFITFPLVFTRSIDGRDTNVGMYRMQVFEKRSTGMHWHVHKDGSHFFQQYRKAGKPMPVAVVIGCDPMVSYAATAPLPAGVNELIFAGFLRRSGVEMVKCKTVDLEVPAHSEIILEGFVSPDEYRREGPFGDHTGYYSLADNYPVFQLTAMTMKKKAVYQSTVVGIPPMEDCYLGHATERLFLPMLQQLAPEVIDHHLPWVSGFHNCHILSFEKEYPYQSRKLMSQIWGLSQAGFCKCVITCSKDAPIHDGEQFLNYFLDHLDLKNSLFLSEGILDVLDHSSNIPCFGSKLGIDISHRIEGEAGFTSPGSKKAPIQIKLDWLDKELAAFEPRVMGVHVYGLDRRHSLMFIRMNKHKWKSNAASLAARVFEKLSFKMFSLFVMIDEKTKDIRDYTQILRRIFHNVDPKRDLYFDEEGRIFIDASYKMPADGFSREWPPDIEMTEDIVKKVDKRLNKAE